MSVATLSRTTFEASRELEYFSERELTLQIGHGKHLWPLALLKELLDNALDACEVAGIAPAVRVAIGDDWFSVQDNGPGIPVDTITGSLDYSKRVSDKALYVSPTRGQLGNALKTLWAAPFVATGEDAEVTVWTGGEQHTITVSIDRIANRPRVDHTVEPSDIVKNGTCIAVSWPDSTGCLEHPEYSDSYKPVATAEGLVRHYAAFNPHATFRLGDDELVFPATDLAWRKWRTDAPTSAHWYTVETLRDLIAGYVSNGHGDKTLRAFVSEFAGLSGTAKQKAVTGDLGRLHLRDLIAGDDIDLGRVGLVLQRMQEHSRAPLPRALGVIGEEHLRWWMATHYQASEEGIRYVRKVGENEGLPYVLEVAFGVREDDEMRRHLVTGLNWSATIDNPMGELGALLSKQRVEPTDPVVLVAHIACPRFRYTERGKGRIELGHGDLRADLEAAVEKVTTAWRKAKRNKEQVGRAELESMRKATPKAPTYKAAAFDVMERAYLHASSDGKFYVDARQIMYAARPWVLEQTGGKCWKSSSYFTQTLLKDYLDRYEPDWKVVWDARGHIAEPHTGKELGLGGLEVKRYMAGWTDGGFDLAPDIAADIKHMVPTSGPDLRYGAVLFIEKEGFDEILRHAGLAERYDLAIMSTKGVPVGAACHLAAGFHKRGLPVFVVHDFDASGFKIARTLREGTRRAPGTPVVDLGFRLADTEGLQSEAVQFPKQQKADPRVYLRKCGATEEEVAFLVSGREHGSFGRWVGKRVELNAMTSEQFIAWLERKLGEHEVQKVVPCVGPLEGAYQRAVYLKMVQRELDKLTLTAPDEAPADLAEQVAKRLAEDPMLTWDEAVWQLTEVPDA